MANITLSYVIEGIYLKPSDDPNLSKATFPLRKRTFWTSCLSLRQIFCVCHSKKVEIILIKTYLGLFDQKITLFPHLPECHLGRLPSSHPWISRQHIWTSRIHHWLLHPSPLCSLWFISQFLYNLANKSLLKTIFCMNQLIKMLL